MAVRASVATALAAAALSVPWVGLVACFDLFHSTSDVRTACELDASVPGCAEAGASEASPPAAIDFCAWTPDEARAQAQRACAWLGACETPLGRNAMGPCVLQAELVYDCAANPNHPAQGKLHDMWACLSTVKACSDVDACVFPIGPQGCDSLGDYVSCGTNTGGGQGNVDVRVECVDGGPGSTVLTHGESCALWGQTCTSTTAGAVCRGTGGVTCTSGCDDAGSLHWCADGGPDLGVDCTTNGAGACATTAPYFAYAACDPTKTGGACSPTAPPAAQCQGGIARTCLTGSVEAVDCSELLQVDGGGCVPGPLSPPWDWTSACQVETGSCTETCQADEIHTCVRGAPLVVDCTTADLDPCRMVTADLGTETHAACTLPR